MNFGHLAIFNAVAETGSITRASDRLMISQPAVSKQLAAFERAIGARLVDRQPRGVRLTDAGRSLAPYAARLFDLAAEAERAVRDASFVRSGRVAVGATPTLGSSVLPPVLVHFRRRFPRITATSEIAGADTLAAHLRDRMIDVIVSHTPIEGSDSRKFADEPLVVVAPPRHRIARRRAVSLRDLGSIPIVAREADHPARKAIEHFLARHGVRADFAFDVASTEAVKQAVNSGIGIAMLPRSIVRGDVESRRLSLVRVPELNLRQPILVTSQNQSTESKSTTAFLCLLKHGIRGSLPKLPPPAKFG